MTATKILDSRFSPREVKVELSCLSLHSQEAISRRLFCQKSSMVSAVGVDEFAVTLLNDRAASIDPVHDGVHSTATENNVE